MKGSPHSGERTTFAVKFPTALWESIQKYHIENEVQLSDIYTSAVAGFAERGPQITVNDIRPSTRGSGVSKLVWVSKDLGDDIRKIGDRLCVPYSAVVVSAIAAWLDGQSGRPRQ